MKYRRPYHNTDVTRKAISGMLPSWMEMASNESSVGWQAVNAFYGIEEEVIQDQFSSAKEELFALTYNPGTPGKLFKTKHSVAAGPLGVDIGATGSGTIAITEADDIYTFFSAPPTRLVPVATSTVAMADTITGICYVVDYDPDGKWVMRDGELHSALVANRGVTYDDYSKDSTVIFSEDGAAILTTHPFIRRTQSFDETGADELVYFLGGEAELAHTPISSSLRILDILNLDPTGGGTQVDPAFYYVSGAHVIINPKTWPEPTGFHPISVPNPLASTYIAEYDYAVGSRVGPITTGRSIWDTQRWDQQIYMAAAMNQGALGQEIPFDIALSPAVGSVALRIYPELVRPGATGVAVIEYLYEDTFTIEGGIPYDLEIGDPDFLETEEAMVTTVYNYDGDPMAEDSYTVYFSGHDNHRITVVPDNEALELSAVKLKYKKKTSLPITAEQSLSEVDAALDPYPLDYFLEGGILYPFTIVDITSADPTIDAILTTDALYNLHIYFPPIFTGVTANRYDGTIWMIEKNNQRVHVYSAGTMKLVKKLDLFLWNGSTVASIPSSGSYDQTFRFINMKKDAAKVAGPAAIFKDWLFIVDSTSLYRVNIFDPELSIIDSFDIPAGVTDITIDEKGRFLLAVGNTVRTYQPKFDYMMVDRGQGIIYYREQYDYVVVGGVADD